MFIGAAIAACACDAGRSADVARDMSPRSADSVDDVSRRRSDAAKGDVVLAPDTTVVSATVASGATLASILRAQDIVASDVAELVLRAGAVFDLRKVRQSQPYRLEKTPQGTVRRLDYEIDGDRLLRVVRLPDDVLAAEVLPIPKTRRVEIVRGLIDREHSSLVAAMDAAGETIDLTLALADIFGGEIDFSTEVQPGDHFQLTVEKQFRVFLASPLKFQPVITSGFSHSRLHPILREYRAHLGVDYKAPAGAPVIAVADGVVVSAGASGGSGRMVHLRHANGFETEYLHLSSIAVRAGARVRQGELVGRVGATGLATGPHLDYRLKRNGVFVNPITAHRSMPPADPIPAGEMVAFAAARDRAFAALAASAITRVGNRNASVQ